MPNLVIAFALCSLGAVACYMLLWLLDQKEDAVKISLTILGFVPKVRSELDKYFDRKHPSDAPDIESLGAYAVQPGQAIVYSSIVGFAALNLIYLYGGAVVGTFGTDAIEKPKQMNLINSIALPMAMPVLLLIGRWVGQRCVRHGLAILLASAFIIRLVNSLVDASLLSPQEHQDLLGYANDAGGFVARQVIGTLVFFAMMAAGYWLGKRQRLSKYFSYLLKQLTPASQLGLVERAYEETLEKTRGLRMGRPADVRPPAAVASAYVMGVSGPSAGSRIPVQPELLFGRDPKRCSVVFPGDLDGISGRHCALRFLPAAGTFELRDLESSNGTFVNDERLRPETAKVLRDGDEFYLQSRAFRFAVHTSAGP